MQLPQRRRVGTEPAGLTWVHKGQNPQPAAPQRHFVQPSVRVGRRAEIGEPRPSLVERGEKFPDGVIAEQDEQIGVRFFDLAEDFLPTLIVSERFRHAGQSHVGKTKLDSPWLVFPLDGGCLAAVHATVRDEIAKPSIMPRYAERSKVVGVEASARRTVQVGLSGDEASRIDRNGDRREDCFGAGTIPKHPGFTRDDQGADEAFAVGIYPLRVNGARIDAKNEDSLWTPLVLDESLQLGPEGKGSGDYLQLCPPPTPLQQPIALASSHRELLRSPNLGKLFEIVRKPAS